MNKVDFLLKTPFVSMKMEEKLQVKRLGPHQPVNCQVNSDQQGRKFQKVWFADVKWLTVSEEKKSLFCFPCLLFGGQRRDMWSRRGFTDLKHFGERVKTHEMSIQHIENETSLKMLGIDIREQLHAGFQLSIQRHNEKVIINRHVLNQIIDVIKFCGYHELALRGHDETEESYNRGIFLDFLDHVAKLDSILENHLKTATVAKGTSKTIQNELLDCMLDVFLETVKSAVEDTHFVSVQADETTDIACTSQFAVIIRFVQHDGSPVERFLSFFEANDRSAAGLTTLLKKGLEPFGNLTQKLIAQTYDGASTMSGRQHGVQSRMKEMYPHAHFVHCYAHQLNLVMLRVCSSVKNIRLFFMSLTGFSSFFSVSPKRMDLLREVCGRKGNLPRVCATRWNFQSRVVHSVFTNREDLILTFSRIQEEFTWDAITVHESIGLKNALEDPKFLFFLNFFNEVLSHTSTLYNILQSRATLGTTVAHAISIFQSSLANIRERITEPEVDNEEPPSKRTRTPGIQLLADTKEACDIISNEINRRFYSVHIHSFIIVDPTYFDVFQKNFPSDSLCSFVTSYPMVDKKKLGNELKVMYNNSNFSNLKTCIELSKYLVLHSLQDVYSEVIKVLQIVLTTPVTSSESERCFSTLKRVKTCLRNTMGQDRLNALSVLSIHKEVIMKIPDFNNKVIERFASLKNRRAVYLFK